MAWTIRIPEHHLELVVTPLMFGQELALEPVAYWEGAVEAGGTRKGQPVRAEGYLEMTGYSGPLQALKQ